MRQAPIARSTDVVEDGTDLATQIRQRDGAALQRVAGAYISQIRRAARGAGLDPQVAEDVTQSTFGTFVEAAPRFEGRSHVRTWLFGILYKKIAKARRKLRREREIDQIDEVYEGRFRSGAWVRRPQPVDAAVVNEEAREGIESCLDLTPPKQRKAFLLREVEGLTTSEICEMLRITPSNLGALIHRARHRLRSCLEAKGIEGPSTV